MPAMVLFLATATSTAAWGAKKSAVRTAKYEVVPTDVLHKGKGSALTAGSHLMAMRPYIDILWEILMGRQFLERPGRQWSFAIAFHSSHGNTLDE